MPRRAPAVELSAAQREIFEAISRSRTRPARLVERTTMLLLAADGTTDSDIGRQLGVDRQRAQRWRHRWLELVESIVQAETEGVEGKALEALIVDALEDAPRPGGPPKFSAEQVTLLISLACEPPGDSGLPISHWTPTELAMEAVKRGIVESISPRHLDRLLKSGRSASAQEPILDDVEGQARTAGGVPTAGRGGV